MTRLLYEGEDGEAESAPLEPIASMRVKYLALAAPYLAFMFSLVPRTIGEMAAWRGIYSPPSGITLPDLMVFALAVSLPALALFLCRRASFGRNAHLALVAIIVFSAVAVIQSGRPNPGPDEVENRSRDLARVGPNMSWNRTYAPGGASSLAPIPGGGYVIAGTTDCGTGQCNLYVLTIGEEGEVEWERRIGGEKTERAYDVLVSRDGSIVVVGFGVRWNEDFRAVRLDQDGNTIWDRTYDGSRQDRAFTLIEDPQGGYLIVGNTHTWGGPPVFGPSKGNVRVMKIDEEGEEIWDHEYDTGGEDWVGLRPFSIDSNFLVGFSAGSGSIVLRSDGGYLVAGSTSPRMEMRPGETADILLLGISRTGKEDWKRTYGGADYYSASCVINTLDGGYLIGGQRSGIETLTMDYGEGEGPVPVAIPERTYTYVLKINGQGDKEWDRSYGPGGAAISLWRAEEGGYLVATATSILKIDEGGNALWEWQDPLYAFQDPEQFHGFDVPAILAVVEEEGSVLLAGHGEGDVRVIKLQYR